MRLKHEDYTFTNLDLIGRSRKAHVPQFEKQWCSVLKCCLDKCGTVLMRLDFRCVWSAVYPGFSCFVRVGSESSLVVCLHLKNPVVCLEHCAKMQYCEEKWTSVSASDIKTSHQQQTLWSECCYENSENIQCLAKVFCPLQPFDLLPHFKLQT